MGSVDGKPNGNNIVPLPLEDPSRAAFVPAPQAVEDLSESCVRFVERALGVKLDYEPETLPVLDHYLEQARSTAPERGEALALVADAVGAYFGEVVRRRYPAWWRIEGQDPSSWQVELEPVYLALRPVSVVLETLRRDLPREPTAEEAEAEEEIGVPGLELEEEDRQAVASRLAELPPVSEQEYYSCSTRLEVIDIAVEAVRARRMAAGEPADAHLRPQDYE